MFAKKTLFGTSDSSLRLAFSPTVPPVFLKVTRLVFRRLTRISIVVVVARRSVAGKWVRRAAKGRVRVAVKRRRSVRIVVGARGDVVCCCCSVLVYGCGDGVCCCCSVRRCAASPAARASTCTETAVLRVKRRIRSVLRSYYACQRGALSDD
mmetsp:Transcript_22466/g.58456  ORF Transcript_22466/g.58456 Transcript_22466/m.58456 type:complete len:152 (+) Transcript_22466:327-782(+)